MQVAIINVHDAKTHFSKLLSRVESGEEIVIAKAGKPVARMTPFLKTGALRKPGSAKGRFKVNKDFFEPLSDEILNEFEK